MGRLYHIQYLFLLQLLFVCNVYSQINDETKSQFHKAEKYIDLEKYQEALDIYLVVLDAVPDNSNINYRVGQCYINLLGQERLALPYLKKAVTNIDEDYKPGDINNPGAPPHAFLLLGDAYHRDEDMKQASIAYHKYRAYMSDDDKALKVVSERIMALGVSQGEVRDHARDVVLSNMGDKVNSKSSDYNIVFSGDEKTMVFTRYDKRRDVIFASYLENGSWSIPVDISDQIGSQGDMYASALSYDGKELYVILLTAYDADIYVSEFRSGQWQYADNVGKGVNSKYIESNASISSDGKTLYFSSDRASGVGGFDIFYSTRNESVWSRAENLGEGINTKSNEESPHITNNGKTLYFSSDRPGSIGRMDVYFTRLNGDTWGVPENMGMPFNSVEDDISFKYYEKYRKGYIARDLPGGLGKLDLYLIQAGADRQREMQDYMASLAPPKPVEEPIDTTTYLVAADTISEPLSNAEEEVSIESEVSTSEVPVVPVVVAVAVVDESVNDAVEEPIMAEPEEMVVPEPEPVYVELKEPESEPIQEQTSEIVVPVVSEVSDSKTFEGSYTVQILALIYPKKQIDFKGLERNKIREFEGDDGYTRYIYGQYNSEEEARLALRDVFKHSFNDAFIRRTTDINNFHE